MKEELETCLLLGLSDQELKHNDLVAQPGALQTTVENDRIKWGRSWLVNPFFGLGVF